jgi:putative hydrolases of HD superfamily
MTANDRDIDLLFEVGTMRHLARAWRQFGGAPFANVAEHSYRVLWIALLLARAEGADVGRVLKMALIHDLPETRTGDFNYVQRE